MKFEVYRDPAFHLIIKNVFPKSVNKAILNEAIMLKNQFQNVFAGDFGRGKSVKNVKGNSVCYYDQIFNGKRKSSVLIDNMDKLFTVNEDFREVLATSAYPISDFILTDINTTQVSRYGDGNQPYNWHQDRMGNMKQEITFVYYFFKEPKKFTGGEISITDSPSMHGELIEKNANIKTFMPENNMGIVFSSTVLHRVAKTKAPKAFGDGRFSMNNWIGFK